MLSNATNHFKLPFTYKSYYCDFETTTTNTNYYKKYKDVRVNLYCLQSQFEDDYYIGCSIDDLFNDIKTINRHMIIYFHNLNFDGDFILKYMVNHGYRAINQDDVLTNNTFQFLRQNRSIYCIKTKIGHKKIYFLCSLKILSSGVEQLGKSIGINKYENVDDMHLFYDVEPQDDIKYYPKNYRKYCSSDVEIVRKSMINFKKEIKEICRNNKLKVPSYQKSFTIGRIAYNFQKEFIKQYHSDILEYNPLELTQEDYKIASKFYFGGFTQFNPNIQYQLITNINGKVFDINSAHPHSMVSKLPYGKIHNWNVLQPQQQEEYIEFYELFIESAIAKQNNVACLLNWNKINNKTKGTRYVFSLDNFKCFYFKEEFEMLKNFYDFKGVKIVKHYWTYAKPYLKEFVEEMYEYKVKYAKEKKSALANVYKILLNSSYGKHATREKFDEIYVCKNELHKEELLLQGRMNYKEQVYLTKPCSKTIELENQHFIALEIEQQTKFFNKLLAAKITSNTRLKVLNAILESGIDNYLYSDTDSIFTLGDLPNYMLDNFKLGYWKLEKTFTSYAIRGSKCYFLGGSFDENGNVINKDEVKIKFSGINNRYIKDNASLAMFEKEEIQLDCANLKPIYTKSGVALIWKDYIAKPRTI